MPLYLNPRPTQLSGSGSETYFLIFFSNSWEKPWCPDCVAAKGAIEKVFGRGASKDEILSKPSAYMMMVGEKTEWRDPNNVHRTQYGITSVPTILKWENGKETARITDPDNADVEKLKRFVGV